MVMLFMDALLVVWEILQPQSYEVLVQLYVSEAPCLAHLLAHLGFALPHELNPSKHRLWTRSAFGSRASVSGHAGVPFNPSWWCGAAAFHCDGWSVVV